MKPTLRTGVVAAVVLVLWSSFFVVEEMKQAVVLQFGQIVNVHTGPGLKFKLPFIHNVVYLEKRVLAWDGEPGDMTTGDKQKIWINTSARWQIVDPEKFLVSVREESAAHGRLDDLVDGEVRKAVARHRVIDLVRGSNRQMTYYNDEEDLQRILKRFPNLDIFQNLTIDVESQEPPPQEPAVSEDLSGSAAMQETAPGPTGKPADAPAEEDETRTIIMEQVTRAVNAITEKQFGIKVLDVRIKELIYVEEVKQEIYKKMISERQRISEKYRSVGQGAADKIRGEKERKLKEILSEAARQAEVVRGEGDAQATRIYAASYGADPEFYKLLKTLETYRKAVDKDTELILPVQSDVFQYMIKSP